MNNRIITVIMTIVSIAVMSVFIVMETAKDKEAPQIQFPDEPLQADIEDYDAMLAGVSATDEKDGDVSWTLMVSNVYEADNGKGTIIYAAKDSSNNITTAAREFQVIARKEEVPADQAENDEAEASEKENDAPDTSAATATDNHDTGDAGDADTVSEDEETEDAATYATIKSHQYSLGFPYLKLLKHEVTLSVGESFVIQRYVEEAMDMTATGETDVSRYLHVEGNLNTSVAGEYHLQIYVTDADGNTSNVEDMVVTIR